MFRQHGGTFIVSYLVPAGGIPIPEKSMARCTCRASPCCMKGQKTMLLRLKIVVQDRRSRHLTSFDHNRHEKATSTFWWQAHLMRDRYYSTGMCLFSLHKGRNATE